MQNNKKWDCKFELGDKLTQEQLDFFDKHGVIIFRNFITPEKVQLYLQELSRIEKEWLQEGREKVNGTPIKFGADMEGNKTIQRFCFTSHFSQPLKELLTNPKFKALMPLLGNYEGRIGENEKDGLVANNYLNTPNSTFTQMGWHTDSPRDLFLGQKILPMLNVGMHLDNCPFENGGLRVLPGTHKQNVVKLLFGKKYFIDNRDDDKEVGFDIYAGDLTVHDGRTWHRVKQCPFVGEQSRRRVMYIPMITGKVKLKHENSKTPFYHRFQKKLLN